MVFNSSFRVPVAEIPESLRASADLLRRTVETTRGETPAGQEI